MEAARRINEEKNIDSAERPEAEVDETSIFIDSDTQGVPGSPEIATTIFKKIRECDIFVADVTFVGTRQTSGRRIPNPNVLIELGYAMANSPDGEKILLIMDTDSGKKSHLPFDLRNRRFPVEVSSAEADSKELCISELVKRFTYYLNKPKVNLLSQKPKQPGEPFLQDLFTQTELKVGSTPCYWLGVAPAELPSNHIDLDKPEIERLICGPPKCRSGGWNLAQTGKYVRGATCVGRKIKDTRNLTFFDNGAMEFKIEVNSMFRHKNNKPGRENDLNPIPISEFPLSFLNLYKALVKMLSLPGSFVAGMAYVNMKGFTLGPGELDSPLFNGFMETIIPHEEQHIPLRFWQLESDFSSNEAVFAMVKYAYNSFGMSRESIPYFDLSDLSYKYDT